MARKLAILSCFIITNKREVKKRKKEKRERMENRGRD